jgi:hypothetical protein
MAARRSLPALVLGGDFGGVDLGDAEADAGMRGWNNLYFLMVLVCVRDNSLVVGCLCSRHPIPVSFVSGQSLVGCAQSSP